MSALIGILNGKPVGDRLHSALDQLDPTRTTRRDTRMLATREAAAGLAAIGPAAAEVPGMRRPLIAPPGPMQADHMPSERAAGGGAATDGAATGACLPPDARLLRLGAATLGVVGPAVALAGLGFGCGNVARRRRPEPGSALNRLLRDIEDNVGPDLALRRLLDRVGGDMSFTLLMDDDPRRMFVARGASGLTLAAGDHTGFIASDDRLLTGTLQSAVILRPGDIATLSTDRVRVMDDCGRIITRRLTPAAAPVNVPPMPRPGETMTQTDLARLGEAVRLGAGLVSPARAPLPAAVGAGIHGRVAISAAAALMPAVSAAADIWRLCYGIDVLVRPLADGARPYLPIDMAILVPEAGEAVDAKAMPHLLRQGGARSVAVLDLSASGQIHDAIGADACWQLSLPAEHGVAPTLSALGLIAGLVAIGARMAALGNGAPGRPLPTVEDPGVSPRTMVRMLHAAADRIDTAGLMAVLEQASAGARRSTNPIREAADAMAANGRRRVDLMLDQPLTGHRDAPGLTELACTLFAEIAHVICLPAQTRDPFGGPIAPTPSAPVLTPFPAIPADVLLAGGGTAMLATEILVAAAAAMRTAYDFARASGAPLGRPRCLNGLRGG
ncbi:hypothetical protein WG926_10850 [Tistrella sp. BH-R2-4]|uniref:Uncharacterized protein n=1 Tax=Tistrella arctica TaxID=3133430 RepID=A0ABU9YJ49_9PROT